MHVLPTLVCCISVYVSFADLNHPSLSPFVIAVYFCTVCYILNFLTAAGNYKLTYN